METEMQFADAVALYSCSRESFESTSKGFVTVAKGSEYNSECQKNQGNGCKHVGVNWQVTVVHWW